MGIPKEILEQIRSAICRPEGTLGFDYHSSEAFQYDQKPTVLFQTTSGGHLIRLERIEGRRLQFFYSSPGTGTRVATIDLNGLSDFDRARIIFAWSPQEVKFCCGPNIPNLDTLSAKAEPSPKQFRIDTEGNVHQIGNFGVELMGLRVHQGGLATLKPTAIEAWTETLTAVNVLGTGKSDPGSLFEPVLAALTLSVLVTGLEAYTKTRFSEIESEGISANSTSTFNEFASKSERESTRLEELEADASASKKTLLQAIVETGRINFQNYDHVKRAFRVAYGIKLGEIGIDSQTLIALQRFIRYRHRIVHISPLLGMLNGDMVPTEEPVFANRDLVKTAVKCFGDVIDALHRASLSLRPPN